MAGLLALMMVAGFIAFPFTIAWTIMTIGDHQVSPAKRAWSLIASACLVCMLMVAVLSLGI
jgi:hypothetical protein